MTLLKSYLRIATLLVIAGLTCVIALRSGPGDAQAAVTLLYFQGQHNQDSVLLEWATATELNTAYFYLERAVQQDGPYQMLDTIGIIPSEAAPDGLSGAEYQRTDDDNVLPGQAYWYMLVEVESGQGAENRTQPIRVALADTQATSTATQTATSVPTATPTPTTSGSPAATSTALAGNPTATSPTATPVSARTVGIRPTATSELAQLAQTPATSGNIVSAQDSAIAQLQPDDPTTDAQGYPGQTAESPEVEFEVPQDSYPVIPPTPQVFATKSYPEPVGPRDLTNGTPLPNIGTSNRAVPEGQQDNTPAANNSPELGTLFLWLGFAAALVVFISAVTGAVYYYSRQRSRNT